MDNKLIEKAIQPSEEKMRVCEHCGKEYVWFDSQVANIKIHTQVAACNCQEEIEKKKEAARIAAAKKERLAKLFDNSMMTPFFLEKKFSCLKETEHFAVCKKYAEEFNPKTSKGISMIGNIGTGKTTLLAAVCNDLIAKNYACLFTTFSALIDRFSKYSYENAGEIAPLLQWLTSFDFVVLDDIGRETYTDKRKEIAFRIVDNLLNYKIPMAFTANPEMIAKLKAIPDMKATLDRLKDTCSIQLQFTGNSLRGARCLN